MRNTVLSAVALATVLCGITMPHASAQTLGFQEEKQTETEVVKTEEAPKPRGRAKAK